MNPTKKYLLTAAAAALTCLVAALPSASAQTALFTYNDGNGIGNAGSYHPGDSFTFSISLVFAPGGTVTNLEGLSYWLQQKTPAGSPFNFSIPLRDATASQFSDLQTPALSYPQNLNPSNANDLGGMRPSATGVAAGTYFIADI